MKRRAYGRWWDARAQDGQSRRSPRLPGLSFLGRWARESLAKSRLMSEFSHWVRRSFPRPWMKITTLVPPHRVRREMRALQRFAQAVAA